MDAKQTNRIFWVGAAAAALWLTYRALKPAATKTTIAVSNTPIVEPVNESIVVTNPGSTDQGWGWGASDGYNPDDAISWAAHMTEDQIEWVKGARWANFLGLDGGNLYECYLEAKASADTMSNPLDNQYYVSTLTQIRGRLMTYTYPT